MADPEPHTFDLDALGCLILDTDINEMNPFWSPELLREPHSTVRVKSLAMLLQGHRSRNQHWQGVKFYVLRDIRQEIVNWHRHVVIQRMPDANYDITFWNNFHESGIPENLVEIASDEEIFSSNEAAHDVCIPSVL